MYKLKLALRVLIDALILILFWIFFIRESLQLPLPDIVVISLALTLLQTGLNGLLGTFRSGWQYLNLNHFMKLTAVCAFVFAVFSLGLPLIDKHIFFPRANPLLSGFIILYFFLLCHRLGWYFSLNPESHRKKSGERSVIIYGAGTVAMHLLQDLMDSDLLGKYQISAFVDNNPAKIGGRIGSYPIYPGSQLVRLVEQFNAKEIWFTMPITPEFSKSVLNELKAFSLIYKIVPRKYEQMTADIRNLNIEDLIKRQEIRLAHEPVHKIMAGKRVLITGAAGSIGREIARQALAFDIQRLVLLDQWEQGIFELENEFKGESRVFSIIGDIQNEERLWHVFSSEKPQIIFHAAAYKHVPLMETNYTEAVKTNILGTFHLLNCAKRWVNSMIDDNELQIVNISTDKAVSPENIMGLTKRVSELLIYNMGSSKRQQPDAGARHTVKTVSVRFGNVLGSSGSVVPLFWQQIQKGGPVTVTHPEM